MREHCKQNRITLGIVLMALVLIVILMDYAIPKEKPTMPIEDAFLNLPVAKIYMFERGEEVYYHDPDRDGIVEFVTSTDLHKPRVLYIMPNYKIDNEDYVVDEKTVIMESGFSHLIGEFSHYKSVNENAAFGLAKQKYWQEVIKWNKFHSEDKIEIPKDVIGQ